MTIDSVFKVSDNSGIWYVKCIKLGSSKDKTIKLGDILKVIPVKMNYSKKYEKKFYLAIVISLKKLTCRLDGFRIKGFSNRVLLLLDNNKFMGTRVYGPICKEMRGGSKEKKFKKIISYSRGTI